MMNQIREGKDFILSSDPYKARQIFRETRKGESYVNELMLLKKFGYKIKEYGDFWRAYK
ncbi:hypothetical protein [Streptococcus zhangguiae]|uniref:hypothetical protein n=1 Tax=Streptococcus zhangguiae TaxID=2664091 RepID=UPI001365BE0B|nr:hypothetical protein [Streptococcus sp. zg-70]